MQFCSSDTSTHDVCGSEYSAANAIHFVVKMRNARQ